MSRIECNRFVACLPKNWKIKKLPVKLTLYDWEYDEQALYFDIPIKKYLCPQGHECYESNKEFMKNYIWCYKCSTLRYNKEGCRVDGKGMYYTISHSGVKEI